MQQSTTTTTTCDVIIVGLGPTGAVLANLLGRYGWSVVGLERDEDLYYAPRAVHFDDEIMRIFQSAGLADDIGRTSESFTDMEIILRPGRKPVTRSRIGSQDRRYGHPGAWWFHQPTLERHFHDGLKRYPNVTPVYGCRVTGVEQDAEGVRATAVQRDGSERVFQGRYLIGCDGGKSFVRREAGLRLESADFDEAWVVVDTKTRSGEKDAQLPANHSQVCNPAQPVTYVPMAGPYYEWQFMVTGGKSEREATDPYLVRQQLRDFVDLDKIEITRIAYYKFHGLWANDWRNGRIILAGDSAHQMPPFLGQGMCSGVRDASSLCWRLDMVLRGAAQEKLFDDYEAERSAHVREIINGAMFLGNVIQTRHRGVAFLRDWLLFRIAGMLPFANKAFNERANRKKPLAAGFCGWGHRLSGHLALQPKVLREEEGERVLLDEALGHGFALLARRGCLDTQRALLERLAQQVELRLLEFAEDPTSPVLGDPTGALQDWFDEADMDFVLIRPDRYVFDAGRADQLGRVAERFLAGLALVRYSNQPQGVAA
ncbi:bifunctional 3-(3-hydroxy-phenyl)propionate/3-hydroxycinnamic acid hydroxylase [Pseudomonas sp. PDM23]|uniref:bifunctional 3-(3-hydroxy-phenyl)propionate/3-hydroxycinnamic acid hydroxylase n=1 Tax=unclassified Pseudomonas TaxID=196821 RepID=UPI0017827BBA|nr:MULTISPECIES: bifunctional 3-(3-hydroxy-phenyl)propionate/3-hydroxycinnamic acid hydroxylase [unclassified Pseudomonas]MBD9578164.1 bifunctional 3-(3-hydroxy-phenyl)propionate/3-hydroxycinnamic acid hydroxylase [Pseudomonas sp. PDM23]MBD9673363.1 bifunctional 3-(3-hydroxy-phenyl)propionate/3-hydroxycinnamic acid hydroxylase [Pseudomonas sp. PDM21]